MKIICTAFFFYYFRVRFLRYTGLGILNYVMLTDHTGVTAPGDILSDGAIGETRGINFLSKHHL
ncbi:MAG TPA: hypothetical protein VKR53_02380 [Puia sp.]|nr:hypothetical protein [Puia sp.]